MMFDSLKVSWHGCCWETFCIFACCGLVVEIPTRMLEFRFLLPFQPHPRRRAVRWGGGLDRAPRLGADVSSSFLVFCGVRWYPPPSFGWFQFRGFPRTTVY